MKEVNIDGKTFQCEKVMPERFKKGTCAFRVKEPGSDDAWFVVVPNTLKEHVEGVVIDSPNDGHIAAFCMSEQDALVIVSSIRIAASVATSTASITSVVNEEIDRKTKGLADKLDFDLDALEAEVKKLKAEGKSMKEVWEILKPSMDEFKKKPEADKGSEW